MADSGDALYQKAESLVKGGRSFFGLGGARYDEAVEKFGEAAEAYQRENNDKRAGETWRRSAAISRAHTDGGKIDAATKEFQAFKCLKDVDPEQAIKAMEASIDFYRGQNPRRAAGHLDALAEFYENNRKDQRSAMVAYGEAGDKYKKDGAMALYAKSMMKHAEYLVLLDADYEKAAKKFEEIAESYNNMGTMRHSLPDVLLKAGMCRIAHGDMVAVHIQINEEYPKKSTSNPFASSREAKFLSDLVEATEDGDPEKFSVACYHWDQMSKLDTWKTAILNVIKNQIETAGEDFS